MTDKQLFAEVRRLGLSIRKDVGLGGEYRIAPRVDHREITRERAEREAYYTNDKDDALATARRMQTLDSAAAVRPRRELRLEVNLTVTGIINRDAIIAIMRDALDNAFSDSEYTIHVDTIRVR